MGMTCTACSHEKASEINAALISGESERGIAGRYGLEKSSVHRHRECIRTKLAAADKRIAGRIANRVESLIGKLEAMADQAQTEKQAIAFLATVRELRPTYELGAKLNGEMQAASVQAYLAALGVQSDAEVRDALHLTRAAQQPSLEECLEEGVALVLMVLKQKPEWRARTEQRICGAAVEAEFAVVPKNGNGNGNGAHA